MTPFREDSLGALYWAVQKQLTNQSALWGDRVYPDSVDITGIVRPYVVFMFVAGGEANAVKRPDAQYTLLVKVVAETQQDAMNGSAQLSYLLNDQGVQDGVDNPLDGGEDWEIITSTQVRRVHIKDPFAGVQPIYHDGYQFEFGMEAYR